MKLKGKLLGVSANTFRQDIRAGVVVFLVALPVCLGIALASGASPFSGIIAGVVGGIVVGIMSNSQVSISGPAAGLAVVVLAALQKLPSFEVFLVCVFLTGLIQLVLYYLKAGILGDFVPSAVIKGMLSAIGLMLILNQLPHAVGYDNSYQGESTFVQFDSENLVSMLGHVISEFSSGAILIALISMFILIGWEKYVSNRGTKIALIPSPLMAVVTAVIVNELFRYLMPAFYLQGNHLVNVPMADSLPAFFTQFTFPDFSYLLDSGVWSVTVTLAVVASLESLLSIEASDKMDPYKRISSSNKELKAQGIGNIVSSLVGGLPITAVVVRSSVNINAGGRTRMSAIIQGVLLLLAVAAIPGLINKIPFACLAAILIQVGYKLVKPAIFRTLYAEGRQQFLPFLVTVGAILFTNLLYGIIIGVISSFYFITKANYKSAISLTQDGRNYLLKFRKDVSFLNKAKLKELLETIPNGSFVLIDSTNADFIDFDVIDVVNDFIDGGTLRGINFVVKKSVRQSKSHFKLD